MIPPNNYLTFTHNSNVSKFEGTEQEYNDLYDEFLKNSQNSDIFNNTLSDSELSVLSDCNNCIVFVLPTIKNCPDAWKTHENNRDKVISCYGKVKTPIVKAWDVYFSKGKRLENIKNKTAVIGIESIMHVPFFDKELMIPGSILVKNNDSIESFPNFKKFSEHHNIGSDTLIQ